LPRIAVTGHRDLTPDTRDAVRIALRAALTGAPGPPLGLSCLAEGADQLFAGEIVRAGGELHAIIPALDYRNGLPTAARARYDRLLEKAARVHRLPFRRANPESFMAAAEFMLGAADELIAVWDGLPGRGKGGTADVVAAARARRMKVHVIWPAGSRRG
jgi:hypothetical protein